MEPGASPNTVHLRIATVIFLICEATVEVARGRKA